MKIEIIDNLLPLEKFMFLKKLLSDIPWQLNDSLIDDDTKADDPRCFYFTHMFLFKHIEKSIHFNIIVPILEFLNPKVLIRAKANLYTYTETLFEHGEHIDTPYECKNAIFYLDNSNGFTRVGNQIIESRENRIALMPTMMHNSTNCSNSKFRMTINFNYF